MKPVSQLQALMVVVASAIVLTNLHGSARAAEPDPFVSGARMIWLHWAEGNCGGRADRIVMAQLETHGRTDPTLFSDGQRAAQHSIKLSVADKRQDVLCQTVLRDFGPDGVQIKGAFRLEQ